MLKNIVFFKNISLRSKKKLEKNILIKKRVYLGHLLQSECSRRSCITYTCSIDTLKQTSNITGCTKKQKKMGKGKTPPHPEPSH